MFWRIGFKNHICFWIRKQKSISEFSLFNLWYYYLLSDARYSSSYLFHFITWSKYSKCYYLWYGAILNSSSWIRGLLLRLTRLNYDPSGIFRYVRNSNDACILSVLHSYCVNNLCQLFSQHLFSEWIKFPIISSK